MEAAILFSEAGPGLRAIISMSYSLLLPHPDRLQCGCLWMELHYSDTAHLPLVSTLTMTWQFITPGEYTGNTYTHTHTHAGVAFKMRRGLTWGSRWKAVVILYLKMIKRAGET